MCSFFLSDLTCSIDDTRMHSSETSPSNSTTSSPLPTLPIEIVERVIDILGDQMALQFHDASMYRRLSSTLLGCSQVCKSWHIRSLRNLYRSIRIEKFKSHGMNLPTMVRNHPGLMNYTRAWVLCEPSSTNITGTLLKVLPISKPGILHLIGCQKFIDHPMFFKLIPVINSRVTFLSLQSITLNRTQLFRLLAATPNLKFLVVSYGLIKQLKQDLFSER